MKRILYMLLLLLPALAHGQRVVTFQDSVTTDVYNLTLEARQFKLPATGKINRYRDSLNSVYLDPVTLTLYVHTGTGGGWEAVSGGGGGGDVTLEQMNDTLAGYIAARDSGVTYISPYAFDTTFSYLLAVTDYLDDTKVNKSDSNTWGGYLTRRYLYDNGVTTKGDIHIEDATGNTLVDVSGSRIIVQGVTAHYSAEIDTDAYVLNTQTGYSIDKTRPLSSNVTRWRRNVTGTNADSTEVMIALADTAAAVRAAIPSVSNKQNYSDTLTWDFTQSDTATLSNRINANATTTATKQSYTDTLTWDFTQSDTVTLSNRIDVNTQGIATKQSYSDTLTWDFTQSDTVTLSNRINVNTQAVATKQSYSDTLTWDFTQSDTMTLSNRINAKGSGTVTSITAGSGLSGGTITTSGTLAVDSAVQATKALLQKKIDSLAALISDGGWTYLRLSSDFSTTSTSLVDITGMVTGTLALNTRYEVEGILRIGTGSASSGVRLGTNVTVAPTYINSQFFGTVSTAAGVALQGANGTDVNNTPSNVSQAFIQTALNDGTVYVKAFFQTAGSGTPAYSQRIQKVTSGTATVYAGSYIKYRALP